MSAVTSDTSLFCLFSLATHSSTPCRPQYAEAEGIQHCWYALEKETTQLIVLFATTQIITYLSLIAKFADSNIANLGSDLEKKVRQAAADTEPAWDNAGKAPGIQIWRIEQFKVKSIPKTDYGTCDASIR